MSRARVVVASAATALIALTIGYGIAVAFNRSPDPPMEPIQLEGPLPTPTVPASLSFSTPAGTLPIVVLPPTLGPSTTRPEPVVAPTSLPAQVAVPPPPAAPTTPPPIPPLAPSVDSDDDLDDELDDDVVEPEPDDDEQAGSDSDEDDADDDAGD